MYQFCSLPTELFANLEPQNPPIDKFYANLTLPLRGTKETTLERADFTLQLFMFVTAAKVYKKIICQLVSHGFSARPG